MGFFDEEELFLSTLAGLENDDEPAGEGRSSSSSSSSRVGRASGELNQEEDYLLDFEFLDDMIRGFEESSPPTTPNPTQEGIYAPSTNNSATISNTTMGTSSTTDVLMPVSFEGRMNEQRRDRQLQRNRAYQQALEALKLRLDELSRTNVEKSRTVAHIVSQGLNLQMRSRADSNATKYPPALSHTSPDSEWARLLPNYLSDSAGEAREQAIKMLKLNWIRGRLEREQDSYWTPHERSNLQKILISQVQHRLTNEALAANRTDMDALTRAIQDIERMETRELVRLVDGEKVDWKSVAAALRSRHSATACERMWSVLDPNSNRTPRTLSEWTREEKNKLTQLLQEAPALGKRRRKRSAPQRIRTWEEIAAELPGRSPHECFLMWCRFLAPAQKAKERWSPEEDAALLAAVRKYGPDWDRVCIMVPGRSRKQCGHRYSKSLAPQVRRGRWTAEEDTALTKAVSEMGVGNWRNVAPRVPGRTDIQCRERWVNVLDSQIKKGPFSAEEDEAILRGVERHGEGKWALVAQELKNRTDNQVWRRFKVLQKIRRK